MTKEERDKKKVLFLEAMKDSRGMTTISCERAGITKATLGKWRKSDKKFDEQINLIKEAQKEWVQGKLMTAIENGSTTATIFFLKTQCGWRETQHIELDKTGDIDIQSAIKEIKKELLNDNQ